MTTSAVCCPGHFVLSYPGTPPSCLDSCVFNVDDFTIPGERLPPDAQEFIRSWHHLQRGTPNVAQLQSLVTPYMKDIIRKTFLNENIRFYTSQDVHRVCELNDLPRWIFKLAVAPDTSENITGEICSRFIRMAQAQTFIRVNKHVPLVIPYEQIFPIHFGNHTYVVLTEQKLDFDPRIEKQEALLCRDIMDNALKGLAELIIEMGWDDVCFRNFAVWDGPAQIATASKVSDSAMTLRQEMSPPRLDEQYPQIWVLDFEICEKSLTKDELVIRGLFGNPRLHSGGLIRCVNARQGQMIAQIAREHNICIETFDEAYDEAYQERIAEIKKDQQIAPYYALHHIQNGDEPLDINPQAIDFSDAPAKMVDTLQHWTSLLVEKINQSISELYHAHWIWINRTLIFPLGTHYRIGCFPKIIHTSFIKNEELKNKCAFQDVYDELFCTTLLIEDQIQEAKDLARNGGPFSPEQKTILENLRLHEDYKREQYEYHKKWLDYILKKLIFHGAAYSCNEEMGGKKDKIVSYLVQF